MAAGFFLAARQHFLSMELGIKNSNLRKQLEDLETEKRRLLLTREVAYSPAEVRRAAIKIGFFENKPADASVSEIVIAMKPPSETRADIVKTVSERPLAAEIPRGAENVKTNVLVPEAMAADSRPRRVQPRDEKRTVASTATTAALLKLR